MAADSKTIKGCWSLAKLERGSRSKHADVFMIAVEHPSLWLRYVFNTRVFGPQRSAQMPDESQLQ